MMCLSAHSNNYVFEHRRLTYCNVSLLLKVFRSLLIWSYFSSLFYPSRHRHGDHLSVVGPDVTRRLRAGEEGDSQHSEGGEPPPQQLSDDSDLCSHERYSPASSVNTALPPPVSEPVLLSPASLYNLLLTGWMTTPPELSVSVWRSSS